MRIRAIIDDTYGPPFFKELVKRMNINRLYFDPITNTAQCNFKMNKMIKTSITVAKFDKVIVISDGEGNKDNKIHSIRGHIPTGFNKYIRLVIFDIEVEEWICLSKDIKCCGRKPSDALKAWTSDRYGVRNKYEKSDLSRYASQIDFNKLKNVKSFMDFCQAIHGC